MAWQSLAAQMSILREDVTARYECSFVHNKADLSILVAQIDTLHRFAAYHTDSITKMLQFVVDYLMARRAYAIDAPATHKDNISIHNMNFDILTPPIGFLKTEQLNDYSEYHETWAGLLLTLDTMIPDYKQMIEVIIALNSCLQHRLFTARTVSLIKASIQFVARVSADMRLPGECVAARAALMSLCNEL